MRIREVSNLPSRPKIRYPPGVLQLYHVPAARARVAARRLDVANVAYVLRCLDVAVDTCRARTLDALVVRRARAEIADRRSRHRLLRPVAYLADRLGASLP